MTQTPAFNAALGKLPDNEYVVFLDRDIKPRPGYNTSKLTLYVHVGAPKGLGTRIRVVDNELSASV